MAVSRVDNRSTPVPLRGVGVRVKGLFGSSEGEYLRPSRTVESRVGLQNDWEGVPTV